MNEILKGDKQLTKWMTFGRTVLCQTDQAKGNTVHNFRPITCLPLLWKVVIGINAENMYDFLECKGLFPNEQKRCRRERRGTKDLLIIDKVVLRI